MSAMISLDNGQSFLTAQEAIPAIEAHPCISFDDVVQYMDDGIREQVHMELAPCTEEEFLARYLELADDDLIIG